MVSPSFGVHVGLNRDCVGSEEFCTSRGGAKSPQLIEYFIGVSKISKDGLFCLL